MKNVVIGTLSLGSEGYQFFEGADDIDFDCDGEAYEPDDFSTSGAPVPARLAGGLGVELGGFKRVLLTLEVLG